MENTINLSRLRQLLLKFWIQCLFNCNEVLSNNSFNKKNVALNYNLPSQELCFKLPTSDTII
jgi:hypothetical protein